jgi:drug/metabolite transporter (DMT)-like permease
MCAKCNCPPPPPTTVTFVYVCVGVGVRVSTCVRQVQFCIDYPEVGKNVLIFAVLSAVGQLFIFYSLLLFDSLVLSTITTTRKFLTIVISVVFHGNVLSPVQWMAVAMVFGAIMYDAGLGSGGSSVKKKVEDSKRGHAGHAV